MTPETTPDAKPDLVPALASALNLPARGVAAVVALLDEGNTVPFIARYRKERTGNLDEVQIRAIEEKRAYLTELEERRAAILASVTEQGKLTPDLEAKLRAATGKAELEDLYAPYRPRRKTRASVAREKGLQPLADRILAQASDAVEGDEESLQGARDIVAEQVADTAEVRAFVRHEFAEHGRLISTVVPGKDAEPTKFEQYYAFEETVKTIPSHRFLAIRRGEAEGVLRAHVAVDTAKVEEGILRLVKLDAASPWAEQLRLAVADAYKRLLAPSVENDVRAELKQRSDAAAVDIFAGNLRNLMLAAPLGASSVIGVDPGLRTGCKCAAIDATGKFLGTITIYISQGDAQLAQAKEAFAAFVREHNPRAIAVGNGTGGREAEAFVKRTLADAGLTGPYVVQVNEAGASVYSASDLAREEFPELDLTIRGAISIARRLQDPLAELVKIEPKSIGVGQYQHDVHQPLLGKKLGDVVESCVNHVGVELNTASAQLLGYVAGIGKSLAKKIVVHRDTAGAFASRAQLMDIGGLGPKAYEQAAGFLRIHGAANPLDASAVHPERYGLVQQMATDLGVELPALLGNQELVDKIDLAKYVSDDVGEPTLRDILAELKKPGRDPRAEFSPPKFRDDVTTMEDLKPGMVLEGVVTNVTAFGAFVDIGVHNDGLVHVSQLAAQFVKDPSEVVKVGDKLTVRVLEVDNQRKRIALSARPPQQGQPRGQRGGQQRGQQRGGQQQRGGGQRGGGRGDGGGGRGDGAQQQRGEGGQQNRDGGRGRGQGRRDDRGPGDQPQMQGEHAPGEQMHGEQMQGEHMQGEHAPGEHMQGELASQSQGEHAPGEHGDQMPRQSTKQWRDRGPGDQARGPGDQPRNDRGPGDQRNDRGPGDRRNDRGPGDQPRNDRGPRDNRGPGGGRGFRDNRGPGGGPGGPGGFRDNRGPGGGGGGGGDRGFRDNRGPGGGGPGGDRGFRDNRGPGGPGGDRGFRDNRGPRDDRGPRGDRGPRDERRGEAPPNWGVSGFTNNPFAKLKPDGNKS
ncbi:MAG: helix-hairpin-helix domain-containing protein [Deltaproteobacteria bacterium]|nr:helix-hairpin-helix domain-containing protein [Deltaproteobacteria bacterium]